MERQGIFIKLRMVTLTTVVFLSAFLLFISEPLIGRFLLPFWGGAVQIWLICLIFFQAMLLLGYLYAHLIAQKKGFWHLILLVLPLINLPFGIGSEPNPQNPILSLLVVLLSRFALPFIILSTTAIVVQSWLSRSYLGKSHEPYPLYAASNAGSLIGLFGYAFLIEPLMGIRIQGLAWAVCYLIFIMLMSLTWFFLKPFQAGEMNTSKNESKGISEGAPIRSQYGKWLLLSSLPSALLLTVTNFISMEIGSFPMIWIIPLALYLCSFIITFRNKGGVPVLLNILWPEILLLASAFYFVKPDNLVAIFGCLLVFFIICILSHGKVYETRPPARWLTNFYLTIAMGGFLGGVSVGLISPLIFKGYFEYLIFLLILGITFWWLRDESFNKFWRRPSFLSGAGRVGFIGLIITLITIGALRLFHENVKYRHRNFYGTYRIIDDSSFDNRLGGMRKLAHGNTLHGAQLLDPSVQMMPVTYYYPGGGISDVYETTPKPRRIAVIGLGAGVICAYLEEKDVLTFFEIDPDNYEIAKRWFTYLDHCKGNVDVITGDGRLSMKNLIKDESKYDIINIDAFTGDGIPTHLLTKEAIEVYLSRLAKDGIILFHISNRFYDLRPLIKSTSANLELYGVMNPFISKDKIKKYQNATNCVAIARNTARLQPLIDRGWIMFSEKDGLSKVKPWTDDYMSILIPLIETAKNGGWANLR